MRRNIPQTECRKTKSDPQSGVLSIPLGRNRHTMHTKKGTFLSYIITEKEAEQVIDFEVYGLLYRTRTIQPLYKQVDYIYSLSFTELIYIAVVQNPLSMIQEFQLLSTVKVYLSLFFKGLKILLCCIEVPFHKHRDVLFLFER